jgi:hypothetical protein
MTTRIEIWSPPWWAACRRAGGDDLALSPNKAEISRSCVTAQLKLVFVTVAAGSFLTASSGFREGPYFMTPDQYFLAITAIQNRLHAYLVVAG